MMLTTPYRLSPPLTQVECHRLRQRAIFECGKWDPQIGDQGALASSALLLDQQAWIEISKLAQSLAAETLLAEQEIALRPELHNLLKLPRGVRRAMRDTGRVGLATGAARVMRFDFHWTRQGWRVSEVNSDVPGGFIEASAVTRLMSDYCGGVPMTADPTEIYAEAVRDAVGASGMIAMVHATAYSDDRQVMVHLSQHLHALGLRTCLIAPDQLHWSNGRAEIRADWHRGPADLVLRFFPAEWLPTLPRNSGWQHYFAGSKTPLSNPATALVTQTKRFPLVWDRLQTPLPTWRALLPETRDPRDGAWRNEPDQWVIKPALGRVGEEIAMTGVTTEKEQRLIRRSTRWHPAWWVVQRRFEIVPAECDGAASYYPCLGVYTIDGRVAGIYGRMSRQPLINQHAQDVAVLIDGEPVPMCQKQELVHAQQ